jgi:hypothetical protein
MAQSGTTVRGWLLLVHNVPARPLYLRARILRLLDRAGAIALKKSVYALPPRSACRDAFDRAAREVTDGGGHAYVCRAHFLDARTDRLLVESSRSAREEDYRLLAGTLRGLESAPDSDGVVRARDRFREIENVDFFEAAGKRPVQALLSRLEQGSARRPRHPRRRDGMSELVGRQWVTRRGIQIDRIASAWLIRRFIDPNARFRFIDPAEQRQPGELRFDMVDADFTHEEDRCTFETLVRRTALDDPSLASVAEIVHDVDIKDGKFGRSEARGVELLLVGMLVDTPADRDRLEKGLTFFDDLYRSFARGGTRPAAPGRSSPAPR